MPIFNLLVVIAIVVFSSQAIAEYKLPDYEKVTLENGLSIYLMEQKEVPLIDVRVVVRAGAIEDGTSAGLSSFTADNLTLGTSKLTKQQLDQTVDFIGANVFSFANLEFSTIGASFAAKDKTTVLPIVRDIVISPRFDQGEFKKYQTRQLLSLEQDKESPRSVINNYFNRLIFGDSGYGSVVYGNVDSVTKLSLKQVKAHHNKWYQPSNAAVIVVGDFDTKTMKKHLYELFSQWENEHKVVASQLVKNKAQSKSNVVLVNKEDATESTFLIGSKGISRANADQVRLSVINTILGGRFTSWLNDELRVNAGLTYGARSRFSSYSQEGSFAISTFTKTETTVEAIDLALKTYARLWEKGIDEKTLASAKAYVKGQFPPKFETSSQLASLLVSMYGYQFDENYINNFEQQVNSLTVENSKQLIKKYFPQENLQFVIVGKAEEIKEKVAKYGDVSIVNIKDVGFDIK